MKRTSLIFPAALAALAIASLVWWLGLPSAREHPRASAVLERPTPAPAEPLVAASPPAMEVVPLTATARLDDILARLGQATNPDSTRKILAELRRLLDALPRDAASREVQSFLTSKRDAGTKLDVTVAPGGALGDASSMRVFLLDYLGQIDRPAAAALGRQILQTPDSPDEWAVSLRNVAWGDDSPATLAYLRAKAREMISNPGWCRDPSAGFLEAFDVIVHAKGFDLTPRLTGLLRDRENRAVAHAAYLTLDRLTLADPASALEPLTARPELMEGREKTRANFFARADVRDPLQRSLLERYLLDPRRAAEELQTFAGLFPNANQMISSNLLTPTPTPAPGDLAARDLAALGVVESWLADPRFARLKPPLTATRDRLRAFVQQPATPPRP